MAAREDRWGGGGPPSGPTHALEVAGATLGFALSGFLDGILFRQILQWHHLLSGLSGPTWRSLPVQVTADGLFHALMYVAVVVGLWMLWKGRRMAVTVSDRRFYGMFLIGFGLWPVVDGIVFHWLLGLHHVRMSARSVLLWDLLFFTVGALIVAAGVGLARVGRTIGRRSGGRSAGGGGPGVLPGKKSLGRKSAGRTTFMLGMALLFAGAGGPFVGAASFVNDFPSPQERGPSARSGIPV